MSFLNSTSFLQAGLFRVAMPASIYKLESFNQVDPEVARRILKSGLANFDKKMLCLHAVMPFPKVSTVDATNSHGTGFFAAGKAAANAAVNEAFANTVFDNFIVHAKIDFSTIDPNHEFILAKEDLEQAKAKLDEAKQIGIDSVEEFNINSEKYGWEIVPAAKISKDDFNSANEEEQINMLNKIDAQKESIKKMQDLKDCLTQDLVHFWQNKVDYLSEVLNPPN